jgi:hypothetical protein
LVEETGSLAPVQKLTDSLVVRQPENFEEDPRLRHQQNLPGSPARLKIAVSLRRRPEKSTTLSTDVATRTIRSRKKAV